MKKVILLVSSLLLISAAGTISGHASLVGLWSFNNDAKDSSGNGLDGAITTATFSDDVPPALAGGKSLEFFGGDSVVEIPHNAKLDITERLTISAWVKPVGNVAWDGVIAKNPSDGSGLNHAGNYELRIESGSRVLTFLYQRGQNDDTASVASPTAQPVEDSVWQHVAVTAVKGGDAIFYLNGEEISRARVPATFGVPNTSSLFIGSRNDRFTAMDGLIDEVALFDEVLDSVAIKKLASGPVDLSTFKDSDGDGISDVVEKTFSFLNPNDATDAAKDQDNDGSSNLKELTAGTKLDNADTDIDGLKDGVETGTRVFVDANNTGTDPLKADSDGDTLGDKVETRTGKFTSASDTGTDPNKADTDGDGLTDAVETSTGKFVSATDTGTDPNKPDTDGDTAFDGIEIRDGKNPFDPNDGPNGPRPIEGLVGLWRFEGNGDDSSGHNLHGALQNGAAYDADIPSALKTGQSLRLNGGQDHFLVPHNTMLDITNEITIAAWVKPIGDVAWDGVLAKNPSEGSGDNHAGNYELRVENGSRAPNLLFETGAPNSTQGHLAAPENVVPEGQWTHLAVTAQAGADLKFYLNGALVETDEAAIPLEFGATNTNPLYIGSRADLFTAFDGLLDDVALFHRVLTDAEIQKIAAGDFGLGGGGTPAVKLLFTRTGGELNLSWTGTGFFLQQNNDVSNRPGWTDVTGGNASPVKINLSTIGTQFYRLRKP